MLNFYMPVRIRTGEKCVEKNEGELKRFGGRCLILTGSGSARSCGALSDVTEALTRQGILYRIFDGIAPNPLLETCREAGRAAYDFEADFIFGIGGGSPMDAAKAAAVFAAAPELTEEEFYGKVWPRKPLPILLLGTTSGTGSEVTDVAVLTDSRGRKHSIHDPLLFAALSFGDPRYTESMPLPVTLSTGIDVLAHSTESYFSKKADEISRAAALESIRLLLPPLLRAASGEVLTLTERERLYEASILGGLAISVTGTCFPHNMGYYLTESFGVPHGTACAAFLPDLLTWVGEQAPKEKEEFFRALSRSEEEIGELIERSLPELEIRLTEEEIERVLPRWENNNSVKNTLGNVTLPKVREILRKHFVK